MTTLIQILIYVVTVITTTEIYLFWHVHTAWDRTVTGTETGTGINGS